MWFFATTISTLLTDIASSSSNLEATPLGMLSLHIYTLRIIGPVELKKPQDKNKKTLISQLFQCDTTFVTKINFLRNKAKEIIYNSKLHTIKNKYLLALIISKIHCLFTFCNL